MTSRRLGVGVVGLGVGEQHARAFAAHPACSVLALFDHDRSRANALAQAVGGAEVVSSFEHLLRCSELDVVAIASYDDDHFEQVLAALRAGKHVFVEKPLCRTARELAQLKECWRAAGGHLKLHSNLILRAAPLYRWLRARIVSGDFGEIYSIDGDYLYGRMHKITHGWRRNVVDYSVMEGGGVHLIDLMLWLTGQRPAVVTAVGNRICTRGSDFRYSDFVPATFEFESGLVARITANFGCVHRHQHVLRVFGTEATFLYDDAGPRVHHSRDPAMASQQLEYAPVAAGKGDLVPDLVAAILDGQQDESRTQSVFDGISVCIAADRAAATGKREEIEYV